MSLQRLDTQNRPLGDILLINKADNRKFHTDKKGFVILPVVGKEIYSITQIGYQKQELKLYKKNANKSIKVILEKDSYEIGEVIVEPLDKVKSTFRRGTILNKRLEQTHINLTPIANNSLPQKIKKFFNIFSIKDED